MRVDVKFEESRQTFDANFGEIQTATGGGTDFTTGNALELKDGKLNVVTTNEMSESNELPITSKGVYMVVGNINALLNTI
jgi:hypothetical protein